MRNNNQHHYRPIENNNDGHESAKDGNFETKYVKRRRILRNFILASITTTPLISSSASALSGKEEEDGAVGLDCLLDLPPKPSNCVRIYLCRHGQTDNNKHHKIQGARIDAPINSTGRLMSQRIGQAIAALWKSNQENLPKVALHSPLLRSKQTAALASVALGRCLSESPPYCPIELWNDNKNSINNNNDDIPKPSPFLPLQLLSSLGEVDFGPIAEGRPSSEVRAKMAETYFKWSLGKLDERFEGSGGESGREVLTRAATALSNLRDVAMKNNDILLAVSHSSFLRIILSLVSNNNNNNDTSLAHVMEQKQQANGCINVIDIQKYENKEVYQSSFSMKKKNDLCLKIPLATSVRINETRHLFGLMTS